MDKPSVEQVAHDIAMLYLSDKDLSSHSTKQITDRYLTSYHDALKVLQDNEKAAK